MNALPQPQSQQAGRPAGNGAASPAPGGDRQMPAKREPVSTFLHWDTL